MADGALICAGCGLLCDDVTVDGGALTPDCELGTRWLKRRAAADDGPAAAIAGSAAEPDAAIARAAELLRGARRPLIHGFAQATIEDARAAVGLADRLGAIVVAGDPPVTWPGAPAFPLRGSSTATLGEIRDRSRVVVIWREDPQATHPRLLSRLGLGPGGNGERTLVVIDDRETATAARADVHLSWPADRDLEALSALHVLWRARGDHAQPARGLTDPNIDGALWERLDPLLRALAAAPHATIIHGRALAAGPSGQRRALALSELVRALNHGRRAVTLSLAGATGAKGADDVLAWQTGYGTAVDLAAGHPELVYATEPLVAHERVDVALSVAGGGPDGAEVGPDGAEDGAGGGPGGAELATIAVGGPGELDHDVYIATAPAAGTMHRLDGVSLTLDPPGPPGTEPARPTAAQVLSRIGSELMR